MSASSDIAVVIPVLADAAELDALLAELRAQQPAEVVVVSGNADAAVAAVCALAVIAAAVRDGAESGCFRFAFQGLPTWYKRVLAWLVGLRIRCGGVAYGDQGIFVRRDLYLALGGFAAWPLFEEVGLVRRLRARGTFRVLPRAIAVATRRWERDGWLRRTLHNRWLALRFALGERPEALAERYGALLPSSAEHER
jgi:hypothetical protein